MASFESSTWSNPTSADAHLCFFVGPGDWATFRIPAGGKAEIPSHFDSAIHDVRGGVIVGGHGPQLVKVGAPAMPVHRSLRTDAGDAAQLGLPLAPAPAPAPVDKPGKK